MKAIRCSLMGVVALTVVSTFTVQIPSRGQGCTAAPQGLVDWWKAEGNALDVVSGTTGTLMNGASFSSGEVGQSFNFNGANQFVKIPKAPNQDRKSVV